MASKPGTVRRPLIRRDGCIGPEFKLRHLIKAAQTPAAFEDADDFDGGAGHVRPVGNGVPGRRSD